MEDITVEGRDMAAESSAAEASPVVRAKLEAVRSGRCLRPEDGACWRCEWYPWPSGCGPRVSVNIKLGESGTFLRGKKRGR